MRLGAVAGVEKLMKVVEVGETIGVVRAELSAVEATETVESVVGAGVVAVVDGLATPPCW